MNQEHKEYLDKLRESGKINMFEAPMFIQDEFGVEKQEARSIVLNWMKLS